MAIKHPVLIALSTLSIICVGTASVSALYLPRSTATALALTKDNQKSPSNNQILSSLMKGEEVTGDDSTLLKMTAIAKNCAAHVKAILGFTIPSDCKPIWLLATLLEQLGLKLTFRKQGKRGQQVKLFSLSKEELEFALQVIAHRETKRNQKENRTYYATQTPAAYSANPNHQPVSIPPLNAIGNSHCQGEDTTEIESPPTDRITLLHCVEILRSGISRGVDAIKGILKRWVEDLRWETVLELEA